MQYSRHEPFMDLPIITVCCIFHVPLISPGTYLYICARPIVTSTQLASSSTASCCTGTEQCSEISVPDCQPAAAGVHGIQHLTASDSTREKMPPINSGTSQGGWFEGMNIGNSFFTGCLECPLASLASPTATRTCGVF